MLTTDHTCEQQEAGDERGAQPPKLRGQRARQNRQKTERDREGEKDRTGRITKLRSTWSYTSQQQQQQQVSRSLAQNTISKERI